MDKENYPGRVAYRELIPVNLDEPFNSGLTGRAYMQNNVDLTLHKYNKINVCISYPLIEINNLSFLLLHFCSFFANRGCLLHAQIL